MWGVDGGEDEGVATARAILVEEAEYERTIRSCGRTRTGI